MNEQTILQATFEEATIGILVVNDAGKIVKVNTFAEQIFGYEKGELEGKKLETLLPDSLRATHVKHRKNYHKQPTRRVMGANLDLYGLRKCGKQFPVQISLSFVKKETGNLALAYIHDISTEKQVLLDLQKSEASNRGISKIVEESLNEIYLFDAKSLKFIQANKGALNNLGFSLEEMQQMTPVDIKPEFTIESFSELLLPLLNGEKEKIQFETVHQRKDQSTYPIETHIQYSNMEDRPVFVAITLNITEAKKAKLNLLNLNLNLEEKVKERTKKLRESQKELKKALEKEKELSELKSRFVSMASHEFRTPLSSILSSAGLISRYPDTEQQGKRNKHIQRIKSSVANLTSILNDFLSLEKLESGKISSQMSASNLTEVVKDALDEIKLITNKDQEVIHKHSGKMIATIDEHLLKNILLNLLSNAVKYSPNGENVELTSEINNGVLVIKIRDYGIGIPEADQQYMFSRFFRATNANTIQGTGLGLTIVKRYLDLMNGSISFESKEGVGTTFTVEIPQ